MAEPYIYQIVHHAQDFTGFIVAIISIAVTLMGTIIGGMISLSKMSFNLGVYKGTVDQRLSAQERNINGIGEKISGSRKELQDAMNEFSSEIKTVLVTVARVEEAVENIKERFDRERK
ncbi:MAG: hypothetical protein FWC97_00280 [Treponema sp.]|nr:hypothetical protein [Treponema sp.]